MSTKRSIRLRCTSLTSGMSSPGKSPTFRADVGRRRDDLRLVPLIVGHPSESSATELNLVLSKYWEDEATFFVISSDFCHWYILLTTLTHLTEVTT